MDINKQKYDFNDLIEVIKILRSPDGCPWDKVQTHESLKSNLIEESYEFLSEIDKNNIEGMKEELGDVLLQVVMHAQIAKDENEFDINDVIGAITKKMIFRHPHVFSDEKAQNIEKAYDIFKHQKEKEKHFTKQVDVLKSIPASYPALIKATKLVGKLNKIQPEVFKKEKEEYIDELKQNILNIGNDITEEKIGEILLQIVGLAKSLGIDSELALANKSNKIIDKFETVENQIIENGEDILNIDSKKLKKYWENS